MNIFMDAPQFRRNVFILGQVYINALRLGRRPEGIPDNWRGPQSVSTVAPCLISSTRFVVSFLKYRG